MPLFLKKYDVHHIGDKRGPAPFPIKPYVWRRFLEVLTNTTDAGLVWILRRGGGIFSIAFHYSWPPGPVAGRSPGANINNYSCKLGARHPRNPKIYVEERLRTLGNSSSNHRKVFHAGKSVLHNHHSLEGKAIWLLKVGGGRKASSQTTGVEN